MNPIPYGRQNITDEDIAAVVQSLKGEFLTQGPTIEQFEKQFANYVGAKYAVAVSNGTAALHLCTLALDVNENTRVITSPITFAASANCVRYCGGTVEFCDIDPATALMDLNLLRQKLESKPKGYYSGIIPVDFAGNPINLEKFRALADEFGCWIIEDACHAPGGSFVNSKGTENKCGDGYFADLAIFSFHPVKHIACGEGGMITTNDETLFRKLMKLRTHGITRNADELIENHGGWYHEMQLLGYNYRITDFQSALGISQLSRADEGLKRRREIAEIYTKSFAGSVVRTLQVNENSKHAYHLYVILTNNRKELYDALRENNIFAQVHYIPCHLHPYYQNLGYKKGDFLNAEKYYEQCLSLPMFPTLTHEEQHYVIEKVLQFAK